MPVTQRVSAAPTAADVERICAVADPVIRNLQITQCYHELSLAMAARLGPVANWCTFATWASRQAGQTIRQEDLWRAFSERARISPGLDAGLQQVAHDLLRQVGSRADAVALHRGLLDALQPRAAFDRASDAVARGNLRVFEEIGHAFARYLERFPAGAAVDEAALDDFCAGLQPGEPPAGQALLQQAFRRYYRAEHAPGLTGRAELILLANLEVGLHEQTRLQPDIVEALQAPLSSAADMKRRVRDALDPGWFARAQLILQRLFRRGPSPIDVAGERLRALAQEQTRRAITDALMSLDAAGERLRLGHDLRAAFPATLRQLGDPELLALLARIDATPDTVQGSGAADWGLLEDRMHFIADLFRCYHERSSLAQPPFTPVQVVLLKAGKRPTGPL